MTRYLIDTHIFLWAIDAPEQLNVEERKVLEDPSVDVAVSAASFWELSIKLSKGMLRIRTGERGIPNDFFANQADKASFIILPIGAPETEYVRELPRIHGDPFDRLLVAQALLGNWKIITRDRIIADYPGVRVLCSPDS
ncbi:MAG: type II toxin-antitoxin system VapC family toxin [Acidobacteriota bacterium]